MRLLEAGDVCWVDFDPVKGTEQAGRRPALILTSREFHENSRRAIVCPISRNLSPWPTKYVLPPVMRTKGGVLVDQVRAVERAERGFRFIERAPDEVLQAVRDIIGELLRIGRA